MAIEIVDLPINSMVDLSIVMWGKTGWWYTYPSEKMNVRWDDDIPIWKNTAMFQTINQKNMDYYVYCFKSICWLLK
jgi:hypothetical protein